MSKIIDLIQDPQHVHAEVMPQSGIVMLKEFLAMKAEAESETARLLALSSTATEYDGDTWF